jgi:hypothetical protein
VKLKIELRASSGPHSTVHLNLRSPDPLVSEVITELRQQEQPSAWWIAVMEKGIEGLQGDEGIDSVVGGIESLPPKATLFLAMQGDSGLEKLDSTKYLSFYKIKENATLWLMCSSLNLD